MAHAAARALGWLSGAWREEDRFWQPSPAEIKTMIAFVKRPTSDPAALRWIAIVLGYSKAELAVKPLLVWLFGPNQRLRKTVIQSLGRIGGERAVEALAARLKDKDADVRHAAAAALGEIGGERAVETLTALVKDKDADVRQAALRGLARHLDEVDRRLLSHDLDGVDPFLDPGEQISRTQVEKAALGLDLSIQEARARYEALAARFGLRLE